MAINIPVNKSPPIETEIPSFKIIVAINDVANKVTGICHEIRFFNNKYSPPRINANAEYDPNEPEEVNNSSSK